MRKPLRTITAGGTHFGEVRTLLKEHGNGSEPLVEIDGIKYEIDDIGTRMLTPRELFTAQGFPRDYIIAPELDGKPIAKTHQYNAVGNSVCPPLAEALVRANVQLRYVTNEPIPLTGGLFS